MKVGKMKIMCWIVFLLATMNLFSARAKAMSQTFGKTTNGSYSSYLTVDYKAASLGTPEYSGRVSTLTCRCWIPTGVSYAKGIVYAADGDWDEDIGANKPGTLLAVTDELIITPSGESPKILTFSGSNRIAVGMDVDYWIGIHWKKPTIPPYYFYVSRDNTPNKICGNIDTYSDGPSNPFGGTWGIVGPLDAYVTYELFSLSELQDNFNDNDIDTEKWINDYPDNIKEVNQQIELTTDLAGGFFVLVGKDGYDFTGACASAKLINAGNQSLSSLVVTPVSVGHKTENKSALWYITNGLLKAVKWSAPTETILESTTYIPNLHKYLRIREVGGATYWDYSPDGRNWINFTSTSNFFLLLEPVETAIYIYSTAEASTTKAIVDNLNTVDSYQFSFNRISIKPKMLE